MQPQAVEHRGSPPEEKHLVAVLMVETPPLGQAYWEQSVSGLCWFRMSVCACVRGIGRMRERKCVCA